MKTYFYKNDLPEYIDMGNIIAIDTEAMGLNNHRDRLCVLQICDQNKNSYIIQFEPNQYEAPILKSILMDKSILKIYHFARFDVAIIYKYLSVMAGPIYCTKIASKLARTYSSNHGLKELCRELLGVSLSKSSQSSYWGINNLSDEQKKYANSDVIYLHDIKEHLDNILVRENRMELLQPCLDFLPHRIKLDLEGWLEADIFSHSST